MPYFARAGLSNNVYIDSLTTTYKWQWRSTETRDLNYSFVDNPDKKSEVWKDADKAAIRQVYDTFETYINVKFVNNPSENIDIKLYKKDNVNSGLASIPGDFSPAEAQVQLSSKAAFKLGNFWYFAFMHETQHNLGTWDVKYATGLPKEADHVTMTIMSYNRGGQTPLTPMALDIATLHYLYGANKTTNSGDNIYTISDGRKFIECIWDVGGKDTIAYGGARDTMINLHAATLDINDIYFAGAQSRSFGYTPEGKNIYYGNAFTIAKGVVIRKCDRGVGQRHSHREQRR